MEQLIAGIFSKEELLKNGLTEERIVSIVSKPHSSAFQVETWFTILNSFTTKTIKSEGYFYAIRKHPASVLVSATLESMNAARVSQGGVPESEPERSKALQMISPYVLTMAGIIKEDNYSGSKLWNIDTVDLANRAINRTYNGVLPLKYVEGKKYVDDKIEMFINYLEKDLNTVDIFKTEIQEAKKNYGDIANQLNAGGATNDNKAVQLFINTFRKPSDDLIIARIKHSLIEEECRQMEVKEAKKIAKGIYSDKLKKLKAELIADAVRLNSAELIG